MFQDWIFYDFSNFSHMQFFGIFSMLFGIIVISNPDILAYLIGTLFLVIGFNILIVSRFFRKTTSGWEKAWKVGGYEIIKNRK